MNSIILTSTEFEKVGCTTDICYTRVDAAGPARDISLLRPARHAGKTSEAVTWHPFYCILHPSAHRLLCLHSAKQVSSF